MQFKEQLFKIHLLNCVLIFCGLFLYCCTVGGTLVLTGDTVHFIQLVEDNHLCLKVSQEELGLTWLYSSVKPELSALPSEERE